MKSSTYLGSVSHGRAAFPAHEPFLELLPAHCHATSAFPAQITQHWCPQTHRVEPSQAAQPQAQTPRNAPRHIQPAQTSSQDSKGGKVCARVMPRKPQNPAQLQVAAVSLRAQGAQLRVLPVTRGPAPATTALVFNSQQLHSRAARQIHSRSPQLKVDNYGCLHQGTALPRLRRKKLILIPLRL